MWIRVCRTHVPLILHRPCRLLTMPSAVLMLARILVRRKLRRTTRHILARNTHKEEHAHTSTHSILHFSGFLSFTLPLSHTCTHTHNLLVRSAVATTARDVFGADWCAANGTSLEENVCIAIRLHAVTHPFEAIERVCPCLGVFNVCACTLCGHT